MIKVFGRLGATSERRHYQARGYQVYRGAFAAGEIERVAAIARQQIPVHGEKLRRQNGELAANDFFPGTQLIRNSLLHPHLSLPDSLSDLRNSLCRLVTSPALGERLRKLDGGALHYVVHQSLLFFAAQTTEMHLDSWSVDTVPLGHSHTVWIPLKDLDHRSGIPTVIPWPRTRNCCFTAANARI